MLAKIIRIELSRLDAPKAIEDRNGRIVLDPGVLVVFWLDCGSYG